MSEGRILVVEDEPKIAGLLKFGLEEKGFLVELAYDGDIGYTRFKSQPFDLVILDLNLPGKNGFELCKAIRQKNENIPIIMVTSLLHLDDKVQGYEMGADDYIVKPFE